MVSYKKEILRHLHMYELGIKTNISCTTIPLIATIKN